MNINSSNRQNVSFNLDPYKSNDSLSNEDQNNSFMIDSCVRSEDVNIQKLGREMITNRSHRRRKKMYVQPSNFIILISETTCKKNTSIHFFKNTINFYYFQTKCE